MREKTEGGIELTDVTRSAQAPWYGERIRDGVEPVCMVWFNRSAAMEGISDVDDKGRFVDETLLVVPEEMIWATWFVTRAIADELLGGAAPMDPELSKELKKRTLIS